MANSITLTFEKDEDKKHSIRFKEVAVEGEELALSTIYVKRSRLKQLDNADGSKPITAVLTVK